MAANISDAVPVIGKTAKEMLLGGDAYNDRTLSRFYILHAAILPTTIILLVIAHIAQIRMHGVTEFRDPGEDESGPRYFNFFPDHMLTELMIGLVLMVLLCALAVTLPATMGPKADPQTTPEVIKPEWFFYVSFRWLKLFSLSFAVISSGFIVAAMFVWPWIDKALRRVTGKEEISVYIGIVATFLLIGLTVWEAAVAH